MDSFNKRRYLKPLYQKDGISQCYSEESAGRNSFLILAEGQSAQFKFPKQASFPLEQRCTWTTSIACMTFPCLTEYIPVSLICLMIIWKSVESKVNKWCALCRKQVHFLFNLWADGSTIHTVTHTHVSSYINSIKLNRIRFFPPTFLSMLNNYHISAHCTLCHLLGAWAHAQNAHRCTHIYTLPDVWD